MAIAFLNPLVSDIMSSPSVPDSLPSDFRRAEINAPIVLYDGPCEFTQGVFKSTGSARIFFDWLPAPDLRLIGTRDSADFATAMDDDDWEMKIVAGGDFGPFSLTLGVNSAPVGSKPPHGVKGYLQPFEAGTTRGITELRFHLANGPSYLGSATRHETLNSATRAEFGAAGWKVTLDDINRDRSKEKKDELKNRGGFVFTHVGTLSREDGATFDLRDTDEIVEAMIWFLSFCAGGFVGPHLIRGVDEKGSHHCLIHRAYKSSPMPRHHGWLSDRTSCELDALFPGFYERWADKTHRQAVELAIYWYIAANRCEGGVEGALVLAHSTLEAIGWATCVLDAGLISESGFDRLNSHDKNRLLLRHCGIPVEIPDNLKSLTAVAKSFSDAIGDGPDAVSFVRNCYVHPTPRNERKLATLREGYKHEVWMLAMHYLELVLLKLFDFKGNYSNRVADVRYRGSEVERVPWAK